MRSHFSLSGIWHLALASGIWYMIYAFTSLSHFEHVHIYWHVHMFTCSHFYHIWKCERRYMRSHSWVYIDYIDYIDHILYRLYGLYRLYTWTLNIWTFEHSNIWTFEHWNIWTCWYLQHSTFYMRSHFYLRSHFSLSCHIYSLVSGCVNGLLSVHFWKCERRYMRSHFYLRSHFGSKCERRYLAWNLIDRGILD